MSTPILKKYAEQNQNKKIAEPKRLSDFADCHSPLSGPSGESRTHGLLNPIQARYQTALHPVEPGCLKPA